MVQRNIDALQTLERRTAEAGPGYRGRRKVLDEGERDALLFDLASAGRPAPEFLQSDPEWIDRRAKLFEAGEYPDKGVTISSEDLSALAARFDLPVPVWIEHAESPLELGYLTEVSAEKNELFGTIALTKEANALVERSGARALSISLSPDLKDIREVSLVRAPRIASARLFAAAPEFSGSLCESTEARDWRRKFEALASERRAEAATGTVERFIAEGKLTPAEATFAEALLLATDAIEFAGGTRSVAQLLIDMIERRPPHGLFSEWAPAQGAGTPPTLLPEEADFYRRHFPDVRLEDIAQIRGAEGRSAQS